MNENEARDNNLDLGSYDGIYRHYSADAVRAANTVATSSEEAQDLVYEAFARLHVQLRDAGPPDVGVEEYLRVMIRRLAVNRHADAVVRDSVTLPDVDDQLAATDDQNMIRRAFEALADDWQQALWHHEVERKSQFALSQGLQMSPSDVAALVFQAREGLRQAYTATRLAATADPECAAFIPNIAIYVKGGLPNRLTRELLRHVDDCDGCIAYRAGYRYLVTNLREMLISALLMPGGPPANPVPTASMVASLDDAAAGVAREDVASDLAGNDAAPVDVAALSVGAVAAQDHVDPDDAETVHLAPVDAVPDEVEPAPQVRPQPPVVPLAPHDDQRRRRALAAVFSAAAVLAIATALVLTSSSPEGGSTSAAASPTGDGTIGSGTATGRLDPVQARVEDRRTNIPTSTPPWTRSPSPFPSEEDSPGSGSGGGDGSDSGPGGTATGTPPPSTRPSPSDKPGTAPEITSHPHDVVAAPGDTATFSVQTSGEPAPAVQWEQNDSSGWSEVAGATSPTLSVHVADASYDGRQYRAVVSNRAGSSTSSAAVISVQYAPQVTANPSSVTTDAGGNATFTASVDAKPDVTAVKWQVRAPGSSWQDTQSTPAGNSSQITLSGVTAEMDGNQYRAVFTNSRGTATTSSATLTVNSPSPSPTGTGGT